jgi:hypothetical protein
MTAFSAIIVVAFLGGLWFCARSFFDWLEQRKKNEGERLMRSISLTPCIKCGRQVSILAQTCPGCGYVGFRGVTCHFCHQRLDQRDAIEIGSHYSSAAEDCVPDFAHSSCIERQFAAASPIRCRSCGEILRNISALQFAKKEAVCSECGSPCPFG